jgi:2-dehydropantoate 2-reductase
MRVLILGAGATGGYFGGRLAEGGVDVTYLVRLARAAALQQTGIVVFSPMGDIRRPAQVVTSETVQADYDVILLACKAYDLDSAIAALSPAMAPATQILPVLNGLKHLDLLDQAFGAERVLGGLCQIAATLAGDGAIRHLNRMHLLAFGERSAAQAPACERLLAACARVRCDIRHSRAILQEMWEKWVLLATLAASTCLMRASIGDIVAADEGERMILGMFRECEAIARASGVALREAELERFRGLLTERGSGFTASMLRDMEGNRRIEADHIIGDLLARARAVNVEATLLQVAYCHLQAYQAKMARGRRE